MAQEIQFSFQSAQTCYVLIRNRIGQIWNTNSSAFEAYVTANYANYVISAVEQGSASAYYTATMPAAITAGVYSVVAKKQFTGSPVESDMTIDTGDIQWGGTATVPLSDLATSGQIGNIGPIKITKGYPVANLPLYFKSSLDHITPFTSGVGSGQIIRNSGTFGPLQSGFITEHGLGFYSVNLTSGDTNGDTLSLLFTANGISGGTSDPLPMSFITQKPG